MKYFTSDLHFFDTPLISYCNRPFKKVEQMNEKLIESFQEVTVDDEVYILGDILWEGLYRKTKNDLAYDKFIKIREIFYLCGINESNFNLILGNHDIGDNDLYYALGFKTVSRFSSCFLENTDFGKKSIILVHDPSFIQKPNTINLCGHVHNLFKVLNNKKDNVLTFNVCPEVNDYKLVSEKDIAEIIIANRYV